MNGMVGVGVEVTVGGESDEEVEGDCDWLAVWLEVIVSLAPDGPHGLPCPELAIIVKNSTLEAREVLSDGGCGLCILLHALQHWSTPYIRTHTAQLPRRNPNDR